MIKKTYCWLRIRTVVIPIVDLILQTMEPMPWETISGGIKASSKEYNSLHSQKHRRSGRSSVQLAQLGHWYRTFLVGKQYLPMFYQLRSRHNSEKRLTVGVDSSIIVHRTLYNENDSQSSPFLPWWPGEAQDFWCLLFLQNMSPVSGVSPPVLWSCVTLQMGNLCIFGILVHHPCWVIHESFVVGDGVKNLAPNCWCRRATGVCWYLLGYRGNGRHGR